MNRTTIALAIILLVAIGGATGYFVGTRQSGSRTQTTTQTAVETTTQTTVEPVTSSSYASECSTSVSPASDHNETQVYELAPGSTGMICLEFFFDTSGNASFVGGLGCPYPLWNNTGCGSQPYQITPSPTRVDHFAGQSVAVAYTITAAANATGVLWDYLGFCASVGPIVIGPIPVQLTSPALGFCVPFDVIGLSGLSGEVVTGVTGMTVSEVP